MGIITIYLLTGLPLLNMVIWCTLRILKPGDDGERGSDLGYDLEEKIYSGILSNILNFSLSCPFLGAQSIDFFAYKIPIIFLLGVNSFFLVWIMVVCKIQSLLTGIKFSSNKY